MSTRYWMSVLLLNLGCLSDGGSSDLLGADCRGDGVLCPFDQVCEQGADGRYRCTDEVRDGGRPAELDDACTSTEDAMPSSVDDSGGLGEVTGAMDAVLPGAVGDADGDGQHDAVDFDCPNPVISFESLNVRPLDVLTLDGTGSNAREDIVSYQWTVIDRPEGSVSRVVESFDNLIRPEHGGLDDDPATPQAYFFIDLAGVYVFGLQVTTASGIAAPSRDCPEPIVTAFVTARDDTDIAIELVWDTPADVDQTDSEGSDLDLHFRHPSVQEWFRDANNYDCYFANPSPDWGNVGALDDPYLNIDDFDGAGPERITLNNPETTERFGRGYRVAVHYYRGEQGPFGGGAPYGPSMATVRIYLSGILASETRQELVETNDFWETVDILWNGDEAEILNVDLLSTQTL